MQLQCSLCTEAFYLGVGMELGITGGLVSNEKAAVMRDTCMTNLSTGLSERLTSVSPASWRHFWFSSNGADAG